MLSGKTSNKFLKEMLQKQLPNLPIEVQLSAKDICRIRKHCPSTIFSPDECAVWTGHVTNVNHVGKGIYVNFYFRRRKVALHCLMQSISNSHVRIKVCVVI
jgi:hypothetical protein